MSFLDTTFNMEGMCFSEADLQLAQRDLRSLLEKRHAEWLSAPCGRLAPRWESSGVYDACYIVELFRIVSNLHHKLDSRSREVLLVKFGSLLMERDETQFESLLSEFQFADFLASNGLTIEFEVEAMKRTGNIGRPDLLIGIDSRRVFVDVTRFRYAELDSWEFASRTWTDELLRRLGPEGAGKVVHVTLPLDARSRTLPEGEAVWLANEIKSREADRLCSPGPNDTLICVEWRTAPVLPHPGTDGATIHIALRLPGHEVTAVSGSVGAIVEAALPPIQASDLLLKAIRGRIDKKLRQFTLEEPYLLCVVNGHHIDFARPLFELIAERVWPNKVCRRLSGILLFTPRSTFNATPGKWSDPSALRALNPSASHPIPASLRRVMGLE